MISHFNSVSHFRGVGSSLDSTTLTTPTYDFYFSPVSATTRTSSVKWIEASESGTPTKRVIRPEFDTWLAYFITVQMKSGGWIDRLSRVEIGLKRFLRPSHRHAINPGVKDNTPYGSVIAGTTYTARDPSGNVIPYPVSEVFWNATAIPDEIAANLIGRSIGNNLGVFNSVSIPGGMGGFLRIVVRSGDDSFRLAANGTLPPGPTGYILNLYNLQTGPSDDAVWPTNTFTAWGATHIPAGKDWMPPIRVDATPYVGGGTDPNPLLYDCWMTCLYLDNDTYQRHKYQDILGGLRVINNYTSPIPFEFSNHETIEPGWFMTPSDYATKYYPPETRWVPSTGSDPTGYTAPSTGVAPTTYVVKRGTT